MRRGDSRWIGGFADVRQYAAYRDAGGPEGDDSHFGAALGTGERRRFVDARQ